MNVYLETSVFIDYLSPRGIAHSLRSFPRRGRMASQLAQDAETLLRRVAASHVGATSTLTCYEVEEALYANLAKQVKGVSKGQLLIIPAARALMTQTLTAIGYFGVQLLSLTANTISNQLRTLELQRMGVRAADALHVTTAADFDADVIVSGDEGILQLDKIVTCRSNRPMRCLDSDAALTIL